MGNKSLLFYDPMSPTLQMVSGEDYTTLVLFCLLKCAYGDSQHIQEHEDHYTSPTSGRVIAFHAKSPILTQPAQVMALP